MRNHVSRYLTALIAVGCAATTAACTSLPSNSEPQALRSFEASASEEPQGPVEDQEPDLLLRDFYEANNNPQQRYSLARRYLTHRASQSWNPAPETLVLDGIEINSAADSSTKNRRYDVRGLIVGSIGEGGEYRPRNERYSTTIGLEKVDGQWRISTLPDQIVVQRNELWNHYRQKQVYFFDTSGTTLVADRRWIFQEKMGHNDNHESALLSLILTGPSKSLAPGVVNEVPSGAAYAGYHDDYYQFTGLSSLDEDSLKRLTAQSVWTLALAEVPGPYRFKFDGATMKSPINGSEDLTVDDFAEYNPLPQQAVDSGLYAFNSNGVKKLNQGVATPTTGTLGNTHNIESMAVSAKTGATAAVRTAVEGDAKTSTLMLGPIGGQFVDVLKARRLTSPSFELSSSSLWVVKDSDQVVRLSRSSENEGIVETVVDTSELGSLGKNISALQLSRSGVRAAFIVDGSVYTATVARPNPGQRKLVNVQEIIPSLANVAQSLAWQPNGSLIIGTSKPDAPVWIVAQDGSLGSKLSAGNIVAPVMNVAASQSTLYISDARAALELPNSDTSTTYWREVQGLEGSRSVSVVPR